jgi:thioesterase-3
MKKVLQSSAKIRFQDCDPFKHLYNTRYLDYFLNAREDQILKDYDIDVFGNMNSSGQTWVVTDHQICYLKPVVMQETVIIESQLIHTTARSLTVEMRMWDENKSGLKSILWTKFIYYNIQTQRPDLHPENLNELFTEILLPLEQTEFEERKNYLVRMKKP